MSQDVFNERLKRISRQGSANVVIPGQVGEPTRPEVREQEAANPGKPQSVLTSILFGGILGAVVGLVFQDVVGVEIFLGFDFKTEWAQVQQDAMRATTWGLLAVGLALLALSWPKRHRWRKITNCSAAYLVTAVGVNAQDLFQLVPRDAIAQVDTVLKAAGLGS